MKLTEKIQELREQNAAEKVRLLAEKDAKATKLKVAKEGRMHELGQWMSESIEPSRFTLSLLEDAASTESADVLGVNVGVDIVIDGQPFSFSLSSSKRLFWKERDKLWKPEDIGEWQYPGNESVGGSKRAVAKINSAEELTEFMAKLYLYRGGGKFLES